MTKSFNFKVRDQKPKISAWRRTLDEDNKSRSRKAQLTREKTAELMDIWGRIFRDVTTLTFEFEKKHFTTIEDEFGHKNTVIVESDHVRIRQFWMDVSHTLKNLNTEDLKAYWQKRLRSYFKGNRDLKPRVFMRRALTHCLDRREAKDYFQKTYMKRAREEVRSQDAKRKTILRRKNADPKNLAGYF